MRELVIGTHNSAKISEYQSGLQDLKNLGITLISSSDLHMHEEPEETGKTFEENALLKAKFYAEFAGKPAVSDDGGVTIEALNGAPGVYSRRWIGRDDATDEELIEYTLKKMENVPLEKRTAAMELVVCFYDPESSTSIYGTGKINGYIAQKPNNKRREGFPYRPIFKVLPYDKYYDDLTEEEYAQLGHRLVALSHLLPQIQRYLRTHNG